MKSTLLSLLLAGGLMALGTEAKPPVTSTVIQIGKVAGIASTDGIQWYAKADRFKSTSGEKTPSKQTSEFDSGYAAVRAPENLATQLKISGLARAHYKMRFSLESAPIEPYAIRLGEINDCDKTYLNGTLIGATGDFAKDEPQGYDKTRIYSIPTGLLKPGENTLVVEVKGVLDKESGIYRDRLEIGPSSEIYRAFYLENLWSLLALVCYLTFGLYFLLFFIRRRHDRENLYFAIFAIALVIYSALHTQLKYEYGLQLYFWKRVQYLALFTLVPAFYYFIRNYYKLPNASWARIWDRTVLGANAVVGCVAVAVALSPDVRLWDYLQNNIITYFWLVYIAGVFFILIREVLRRNKDAIIMIVSFFILLASMVLDILSGRAVINLPPLLTYVFIFFILSMAFVLANRFVRLHDETEQLNENLSKYNAASRRFVPFEFLKMLDKNSILDVNLGDQVQRDMAVLFSDIRGFTSLSEKMTPKENFDFINSYLDKVGPVIRDHHGFIDKYIGDAVMALFPSSAADALEAALSMHERVHDWNARRAVHGYAPVTVGIGIHHGRVMLGTIGEHQRMDGTVIADAVNLASRIESLTKNYGSGILISEISWNEITDRSKYHNRLIDRVAVKGKTDPVGLIEVFNCDSEEAIKFKVRQKDSFSHALNLYGQGLFHEAKSIFLELAAANSLDRAIPLYLERIERHIRFPPGDWRGFDIMTEK
jgi:adenylate cyclase